ncbi:MAG: FAD-dependent oxidoreductase, partial [Nocardioidaceae bacterium]
MADTGRSFDIIVVGGGSGGYACALRAAELGLDVALVEQDKLGGTCLHRGCIPTKALLHAGEVADSVRESGTFGVQASLDGVDLAGVNAYKDGVVSRLYKGLQGLVDGRGVTVIEGHGTLVAPHTVEVDGTRYDGRHVVLASGSSAKSLPGLDIDGERVISSDHALTLEKLPDSVVILGGGVIGVEFASAWRSFGVDVTIVEALPRLVPTEDADSSKVVERAFRKRGIAVKTGTAFTSVETGEGGVTVTVESGATYDADLLLVAVGRGPTTSGLGYETQGVEMDQGNVCTNERLQTSVDGVLA